MRKATLLAAFALGACAAPVSTADPAQLLGRSWRLTQIGGEAVAAPGRSTLAIAKDGAVSGDAGCNRYAGRVDASGDRLAFSPLAATKRACAAAAVNAQEVRLFNAFERTAAWRLDGENLALLDRAGRPLLLFAPAGK